MPAGRSDNDGVPDEDDSLNYREWADADEDGEGDNADSDDDNVVGQTPMKFAGALTLFQQQSTR